MAKLYTRKSDGTYVPYNPQSVTNIDVVQTTGDSVTAAMSQDAVTKELTTKQNTLTTGNGINIEGNVIGVTAITESESQPDTSLWLNPSEDEETDVTYNRSQIDAMVGAKQDALQLTVKDNGNIVLSNIQGQSKEFMPATPSGDPMHYAYIAAGAEYNDTGEDIVKTAPWADMIDDDYTGDYGKTVIHKAGHWYLNGLGNITNDEIRKIYTKSSNFPESVYCQERFRGVHIRTNFNSRNMIGGYTAKNMMAICAGNRDFVVFSCNIMGINSINNAFLGCSNLVHVIGLFNVQHATGSTNDLGTTTLLTTIMIQHIKVSTKIISPNLSIKSILYMIKNEASTSPITITLHADAYARAMANADIVAALEAHPNVSLASA